MSFWLEEDHFEEDEGHDSSTLLEQTEEASDLIGLLSEYLESVEESKSFSSASIKALLKKVAAYRRKWEG
jgi:hypothetical protein